MDSTLISLFKTAPEAQMTINGLVDLGIPGEDVSLIVPQERAKSDEPLEDLDKHARTDKRVEKGAAAGAVAGGALGALAGAGALAIPGLGPIVAAGPIAAAIGGAGFGGIGGSLVGTIRDIGVGEERANFFADRMREGHALVIARVPEEKVQQAMQTLEMHGAVETAEKVMDPH